MNVDSSGTLDPLRILQDIWLKLTLTAESRDEAPLRTCCLATIGADGAPRARTIVLRRIDQRSGALYIYTDLRSPKAAELLSAPRASLCFYSAPERLQFRIDVDCTLHCADALCDEHWAGLPPQGRENYRSIARPSSPIAVPAQGEAADGDGQSNFAVIRCAARRIDWLWLRPGGHRRLLFDLKDATHTWLAP